MRIVNQLFILLVVCAVTCVVTSRSRAQTAAAPDQIPAVSTHVAAAPQVVANPYTPTTDP